MSATQTQKLIQELNDHKNKIGSSEKETEDFKRKIQGLLKQNESLDGEVRQAQEGLRLSTSQNAKLMQELNAYKQQIS